MNSAVAFNTLAKSTRSIILASGTLAPNVSFESELGTKFVHKLTAKHVINEDQVYVRGIPRGPNGVDMKVIYNNVGRLDFQVINIISFF